MENLNNDEVGLILKKVTNSFDRKSCARVCTQWRKLEASTRESLRILDSKFLPTFLPRYRNLLTLESERGICDSDLELIAETCLTLQFLNLNMREITGFGDVFSKDRVTDVGICSLADHCRDLRKVCLRKRKALGNAGVTALMKSCHKLTHLDLGFCNKVTDQALEAIGRSGCLEILVLRGCTSVGDRGLASLASGSTARTLKRLDLCQCSRITDLGVRPLQEMSCLQVLNLAECGPTITDSGGVALGGISTLEEINFSWLINISDVSLLAIAKHCSNLKTIVISGCPSVTGDGVLAFTQHAYLEAMILDNCSNIRSEDVEQVVLECPALGYLGLDRGFRHWIPASVMGRIEGRCHVEWL